MSVTERNIQVTLTFKPPEGCPLQDIHTDVGKVLVDREGEMCRCDLVISVEVGDERGTLVAQVSGDVGRCAGTVFEEYNCVPEVIDVTQSQITVRTYVDPSTDIDSLLEDLREVCESVTLKRVSTDFDRDMAPTLRDVDLSSLTGKQREAMEIAIREGYYARPREISLSELATTFDISQQALAQRLARAEEQIMKQLITD